MLEKSKPWISYYGGKQRLARHIVPLIPPHRIYCEPFFGGGAVMFYKGRPASGNYLEVINDVDGDLINFYRVMQDPAKQKELFQRLEWTPYSEEEYKKALDEAQSITEVEKAWSYLLNMALSFSNKKGGGFGRRLSPSATNFERLKHNLFSLRSRFRLVEIQHNDALKVIESFDSRDTFFYCDPPYPGTNCGHYEGYTLESLQALVNLLDGIKGTFILSNYPQPELKIPSSWRTKEFEHSCTIDSSLTTKGSESVKRKEVLWMK